MTEVPAHAATRHEAETPATNTLREALPDKIQLNGKTYTSIQTVKQHQELYKVTMDWNHQEWNNNELILEISLKNIWQEYSLKNNNETK